MDELITGLR